MLIRLMQKNNKWGVWIARNDLSECFTECHNREAAVELKKRAEAEPKLVEFLLGWRDAL